MMFDWSCLKLEVYHCFERNLASWPRNQRLSRRREFSMNFVYALDLTLVRNQSSLLCPLRCKIQAQGVQIVSCYWFDKRFTLDITMIIEVHNHLWFQGTWRAKNPLYLSPQSFCASSWLKFSREIDSPNCAHVIKYRHCLSLRYCN